MAEFPGAIGDVYSEASTPGASGSMNSKLRLMTTQLNNLTILNTAASGVEVVSSTGDVQAVGALANLRLIGVSIRENAGTPAAALVLIRHGTSISDPVHVIYELASNESVRDWFGDSGIAMPNGIFVDRGLGESHLVLYVKVVS